MKEHGIELPLLVVKGHHLSFHYFQLISKTYTCSVEMLKTGAKWILLLGLVSRLAAGL